MRSKGQELKKIKLQIVIHNKKEIIKKSRVISLKLSKILAITKHKILNGRLNSQIMIILN